MVRTVGQLAPGPVRAGFGLLDQAEIPMFLAAERRRLEGTFRKAAGLLLLKTVHATPMIACKLYYACKITIRDHCKTSLLEDKCSIVNRANFFCRVTGEYQNGCGKYTHERTNGAAGQGSFHDKHTRSRQADFLSENNRSVSLACCSKPQRQPPQRVLPDVPARLRSCAVLKGALLRRAVPVRSSGPVHPGSSVADLHRGRHCQFLGFSLVVSSDAQQRRRRVGRHDGRHVKVHAHGLRAHGLHARAAVHENVERGRVAGVDAGLEHVLEQIPVVDQLALKYPNELVEVTLREDGFLVIL
eukprot:5355595-Pleurochrysis_carterae.AAC.2